MIEYIEIFILMVFAHFLGDYIFQNNTIAANKSRKNDILHVNEFNKNRKIGISITDKRVGKNVVEYVPKQRLTWFYYMTAHSITHGWLLYYFTGNLWLGVIEAVLHFIIDHIKCEGKTNIHIDQLLHLITKIGYITIIILGVV